MYGSMIAVKWQRNVNEGMVEIMTKANAKFLLVLIFMARGTSFLFSRHLLNSMSPLGILATRFSMAFLILAVIYHKKIRTAGRAELRGGLVLGFLYFICMVFEMYGLQYVDTGISALIENMAIILVPIYGAVLTRKLPRKKTILCAFLAVAGVGFLSLSQMQMKGSGFGLLLIILAAMTYGICIMATESVSRDGDPLTIGMFQLGFMGLFSFLAALPTGSLSLPSTGRQWSMMMLLVLLCSCFGFAFQPLAQKYVSAETAAVFTVINPLTAGILGIVAAGEKMDPAKAVGCILILLALVIYNSNESGAGFNESGGQVP